MAAELRGHDADAAVTHGVHPESGVPWVDLTVTFEGQEDFKYQVYPVAYPVPSFAGSLSVAQDTHFQLEVFSAKGSRGRDVLGYSREQLCADVLDDYEAHLTFLAMTGEDSHLAERLESEVPDEWGDADRSPATGAMPAVDAAPASQTDPTHP